MARQPHRGPDRPDERQRHCSDEDVAARIEREAAGAGADLAKVQIEVSSNLAEMTASATTSRIEQLVAEVERRKREQGLIDVGPADVEVIDPEQ